MADIRQAANASEVNHLPVANEAMELLAINKASWEKTSATVKYNYGSPYVNDKPSLNPNLKINDRDEEVLKASKKADMQTNLKKSTYKPGGL